MQREQEAIIQNTLGSCALETSNPVCISATGSIAEDNMVEIGRAVGPPSTVTSSGSLDVAVKNLEDYCNGLLNTWVIVIQILYCHSYFLI